MSAVAAEPTICPVCSVRSLRPHCESATCGWQRCRNQGCLSTLDLGKRKGYKPVPFKKDTYERVLL